ncbi:MAG: PAS domain-containing sensor histidine kinase [Mucilaginibacter sp.]
MKVKKAPDPTAINNIDGKFFRLIVANIEDHAILMIDPNGYILSWNQGAQHIKGYTEEEIIGKHISTFYTSQDIKNNVPRNNLNEALKKGVYQVEGWRVKKDGTLFWADVVFTTIYNDEGHLAGFAKVTRDVTERKKKEDQKTLVNAELERRVKENTEKIIANETRFRQLIENSYDGISLIDKAFNVIYRSKSSQRINGWSNNEVVTASIIDLAHPDDKEIIEQVMLDLLDHPGTTMISNHRSRHRSGNYIWLECVFTNMLNNANINAIVCNFRDVTEKKRADEEIQNNHIKLVEASQKQEAILNALPPNVVLINKKGKIIAVNESWKKFTLLNNLGIPNFGISYSYLAISERATGVDKVNNNKIAKGINDVIKGTKKEFTLEYACTSNQKKAWYQVVIAPIADGSQSGAVILHIDITDRKKAEELLLQSEANLRSVFENTDLAIVLFDTELKIVSFNTNARDQGFANFNKKLKVGASAFSYFPKQRKPIIKKMLQRVYNGETAEYETCYLINGVEQWYEARWISVINNQQVIIGVILTLQNITGKKLADLERDKITADLVQRNKDLEQFTYIVSHNLRAPVANIRGLSNLLNGYEPGEMDAAETLQALSYSVNNLDKVIIDLNSILQISKQVNDTIEPILLTELVDEVQLGISEMVRKNKVVITCNFEAIDRIYSLKGYIYSIFQNMVINSIKYRRTDIRPEINISSQVEGDKVHIFFKDNGKGIDLDKNASHLFGLYKRFDTSVEGKGMGLFMVKLQAESLGGNVTVKSKLNEGTEFRVELPVRMKDRYVKS